jgi:multimeric flavodoxin WrbA
MARILIVFHSQTGNTERLASAVKRGVTDTENAQAIFKRASDTIAKDIRACDALVICSPEYFGYMAGAVKDLFDRTFDALKDDWKASRKPYCVVISAGNDGTGALTHIERICMGYRFKKIQHPVICKGPLTEDVLAKCYELGRTVAEGVNAGVF